MQHNIVHVVQHIIHVETKHCLWGADIVRMLHGNISRRVQNSIAHEMLHNTVHVVHHNVIQLGKYLWTVTAIQL